MVRVQQYIFIYWNFSPYYYYSILSAGLMKILIFLLVVLIFEQSSGQTLPHTVPAQEQNGSFGQPPAILAAPENSRTKINLVGSYLLYLPKIANLIQNAGEVTYFGGCNEYQFYFSQNNNQIKYRAPKLVSERKCNNNFDSFYINAFLKAETVYKSHNDARQKYLDKDSRVLLYRQEPVPRAIIQYALQLPPVKVSIDESFVTFQICNKNVMSYKVKENGKIRFRSEKTEPLESCNLFKYDKIVTGFLLNAKEVQVIDGTIAISLNEEQNEDNARFEATRNRKIILIKQEIHN